MRRPLACLLLLVFVPLSAVAEEIFVTRRDGFLTIWQSLRRPVQGTHEHPFSDVADGSTGFVEITYAKARGILDDEESFRPDAHLELHEALVWLLRTRSVDLPENIQSETLSGYLLKYPVVPAFSHKNVRGSPGQRSKQVLITADHLLSMMRALDTHLADEVHDVSLYAEKFHGRGTAFGETFDMHALTAAHRTFPHNTLVRVTNMDNGKSVIVRINDRGPFVDGRDMDLSLGAFTAIGDRTRGVIRARFERLGDATMVDACIGAPRFQARLTRDVRLQRGIPHTFRLGETLVLRANKPFVVRSIRYPDGVLNAVQNWMPLDDRFTFRPSVTGEYFFRLGTLDGRHRTMRMTVVECGM